MLSCRVFFKSRARQISSAIASGVSLEKVTVSVRFHSSGVVSNWISGFCRLITRRILPNFFVFEPDSFGITVE